MILVWKKILALYFVQICWAHFMFWPKPRKPNRSENRRWSEVRWPKSFELFFLRLIYRLSADFVRSVVISADLYESQRATQHRSKRKQLLMLRTEEIQTKFKLKYSTSFVFNLFKSPNQTTNTITGKTKQLIHRIPIMSSFCSFISDVTQHQKTQLLPSFGLLVCRPILLKCAARCEINENAKTKTLP